MVDEGPARDVPDDLSGDLSGRHVVDADLRGARFVRADLSGVVMRAVDVARADIDAPWLLDGRSTLLVNGVDVAPFVDAELDRRFPGRAERRAEDPDGLRAAWTALERAWAATLARVAAMPPGSVDVSVDGEWSFAQTLRHPTYEEVLEVRAARVTMVRELLVTVTAEDLAVVRRNPWAPEQPVTTLSCLHTILEKEWEHLRFAVRDLDTIDAGHR